MNPEAYEIKKQRERERYRLKKEHVRALQKEYYKNNREDVLASSKNYYNENKELRKQQMKSHYENNKAYHQKLKNEWDKRKRQNDPNYKLRRLVKDRLKKALLKNYKTGVAIKELGCSISELKAYLESLFQPGMTWENHGKWHIDHIKPLASFTLTNPNELAKACHFTNLQPLWAEENLSKGSKY